GDGRCGGVVVAARRGCCGWHVVASGIGDRTDRVIRNVFGVCRKNSSKNFFDGGDGGGGRLIGGSEGEVGDGGYGGVVVAARRGCGGWHVVASGIGDRIDRVIRNVFGVRRKNSPEKFSGGGDGGGGSGRRQEVVAG
nr:hypothetical protein [Tanacetum cinerariifolium]